MATPKIYRIVSICQPMAMVSIRTTPAWTPDAGWMDGRTDRLIDRQTEEAFIVVNVHLFYQYGGSKAVIENETKRMCVCVWCASI